jgi:drug/metabolite transporter (DMT)-like permease
MAQLADDITVRQAAPGVGVLLAVVSAASFGLSGPLATGLLANGWSPGAIVLGRVALAALALAPFTIAALRGRWHLLRRQAGQVLLYGVLAVAGAQFCYFSAVATMDVAPALLIEYTSPAAVVAWLWLRRGQRPSALTVGGAVVAAAGLLLVLDLFSGFDLAWSGVAWSLGAMIGATAHFLIAADTGTGLPPMAFAGTGLTVGALGLLALAVTGLLPMHASTAVVDYSLASPPWWVPMLLLGLVTAALPYVTGIAASRLLGSRVASFVALLEVVAAILFAWLLVAQLPAATQFAGGVLIIGGVIAVRLGDRELT